MGKIVIYGDSVVASANVTLAERWAQKVGLAAGYAPADIIIAGNPGEKSLALKNGFQVRVMDLMPDTLLIMPTVNDTANGIPLAEHVANTSDMIERAQAAGINVVIVTPPVYRQNVIGWRPTHEEWVKMAAKYKCHLVDATRAYAWEYAADPVAFNNLYVNSTDLVHQSGTGNTFLFSVCNEPTNAGKFMKAVPPIEESCGDELTLALADLARYGATIECMQRVMNAMPVSPQ